MESVLVPAYRGLKPGCSTNDVALTDEVVDLLARNCVVAIGVSGGKDSDACAIAVSRHLDRIGHTGPRVLIHADLGRVEWKDSLPSCQRLAEKLGWELMVVRRKAGDMLARWEGRWANNVARYNNLECVKLILPWSTPALRFCTSELKTSVICAALRKRFPNNDILNVTGVRREESATRRKMPISEPLTKLQRKGAAGVAWNAIIEFPVQDVFATIHSAGLRLHEAYTVYGASRVSCCFCIMSAIQDLIAAAGCADNHDLYRSMVDLEIASTYAFQGGRWLADTAPHLLSPETVKLVAEAKENAVKRQVIEAELPAHLLYTSGWPTCLPTMEEAELIASVRRRVSSLLRLESRYLDAESVRERYAELIAEKAVAEAKKAAAKTKKSRAKAVVV
uniref:Putative phosphoadenosine phosphosulfate n=1 Tax=viral metagenome TaxID=1070528 RepID=A0A6H1ZK70_9ZZZZ